MVSVAVVDIQKSFLKPESQTVVQVQQNFYNAGAGDTSLPSAGMYFENPNPTPTACAGTHTRIDGIFLGISPTARPICPDGGPIGA
jgi:hypothetical protein